MKLRILMQVRANTQKIVPFCESRVRSAYRVSEHSKRNVYASGGVPAMRSPLCIAVVDVKELL